jgi:hypothetical protein
MQQMKNIFAVILLVVSHSVWAGCVVQSVTQVVSNESGPESSKQESIIKCSEGNVPEFRPVKIGDLVAETELSEIPKMNFYFSHKNSQCRLFREHYRQKKILRVTHGVICQTGNQGWIVVDKW